MVTLIVHIIGTLVLVGTRLRELRKVKFSYIARHVQYRYLTGLPIKPLQLHAIVNWPFKLRQTAKSVLEPARKSLNDTEITNMSCKRCNKFGSRWAKMIYKQEKSKGK
jgi:hypothetical protein